MEQETFTTKNEELQELRNFVNDLYEEQLSDQDTVEDEKLSIGQWKYNIFESLYEFEEDEEVEHLVAPNYKEFNIQASQGKRNYKARVYLDEAFSNSAEEKIREALDLMIAKMVEGQIKNFKKYAKPTRNGLRYRRVKNKPFPHSLPYMNPSPSNIQEQIIEEAGVVEAAVFFAFNAKNDSFRRKLYIDSYTTDPDIRGKAVVNYYNEHKQLKISLNRNAFADNMEARKWAGIIAHELLHNLGWQHPLDEYTLSMPIEIYQACISDGHHLASHFIR